MKDLMYLSSCGLVGCHFEKRVIFDILNSILYTWIMSALCLDGISMLEDLGMSASTGRISALDM